MQNRTAKKLTVTGQVQGVGFRPFVYRLAIEGDLAGSVKNTPEGVVIELHGEGHAVDRFTHRLKAELPPLARIVELTIEEIDPDPSLDAFTIEKSSQGEGHSVLISPDVATCDDCLADMGDPKNRRYRYPFTNCTNCGPRYTITQKIPYDRETTSMACFPMCEECRAEYEDPLNRRFHAQPNACPVCGPRVWLADNDHERLAVGDAALADAAQLILDGRIVAVKGLGGFHLAVNGFDHQAVQLLRARKNRWSKPLALMVPDIEAARALAHVTQAEESWLTAKERPIVLLKKRGHPKDLPPLSPDLAPDVDSLGVMLPYTPLHHVLLAHAAELLGHAPALVMTSGNASSEPICLGNREARKRLGRIADNFVFHDRDILIRTDDTVMRLVPSTGDPMFLRRARGFTPSPVFLAHKGPTVMGTGPELKNTLCVTKENQAFVSQHIGDMENLETYAFFKEIAVHLHSILQTTPRLVVHDLHPNYMTTSWAEENAAKTGTPTTALQHHFAHIHAVIAEHSQDLDPEEPVLGLALDGTGYGEDKTLWGGELLYVNPETLEHRRLGHFYPMLLPGGEAAIKEPWRIALGCLHALGRASGPHPRPWEQEYSQAAAVVDQMIAKKINCPVTTSCGRLFDAIAALIGARLTIDYEGQAAIILETIQNSTETFAYQADFHEKEGLSVLDTLSLFRQALDDLDSGLGAPTISRRFHLGLIHSLTAWAAHAARLHNIKKIALSGGVMQNLTLAQLLPAALTEHGLTPLTHTAVPPNDACISLGQAAYGQRVLLKR